MFAIKSKDNGTYYTGEAFVGPKFGGGPVEAVKFADRMVAAEIARRFPLVVLFEVVEVYTAPCGDCGTALWVEEVPLLPEATLTKCPACDRSHVVYQTKGQLKAGRVDMAKTGKPAKVGDEMALRFVDGDPRKAAES